MRFNVLLLSLALLLTALLSACPPPSSSSQDGDNGDGDTVPDGDTEDGDTGVITAPAMLIGPARVGNDGDKTVFQTVQPYPVRMTKPNPSGK